MTLNYRAMLHPPPVDCSTFVGPTLRIWARMGCTSSCCAPRGSMQDLIGRAVSWTKDRFLSMVYRMPRASQHYLPCFTTSLLETNQAISGRRKAFCIIKCAAESEYQRLSWDVALFFARTCLHRKDREKLFAPSAGELQRILPTAGQNRFFKLFLQLPLLQAVHSVIFMCYG